MTGGWAATAGPVISTDASFTIAAWAKFDDLGSDRTIAAQGFTLGYGAALGRVQFAMPPTPSR